MAIYELFSKRQKKIRGEVLDTYVYDYLPPTLRTQIVHIWFDTLGRQEDWWTGEVRHTYKAIVDALCREYGLFRLPSARNYGDREYINELCNFFLNEDKAENNLDVIELTFQVIDTSTRRYQYLNKPQEIAFRSADTAVNELNTRFKEHGVGYQFADGEIIRVDSELIHSEVVKPALRLLSNKQFAGAQDEFLKAHEHYRHGNSKEALNECLKALESFMKSICSKRGWTYAENATAKTLIQICFDNELVPSFWQQNLSSLRSLLESSVPTGRNKLGGHGQGISTTEVPNHLVGYMLHMTASTLVFLGESDSALP